MDPELPVSIVDMGLVCDVRDNGAGDVVVDMTFTSIGCPAMGLLRADVRDAAKAVDGVRSVAVNVVWDPPWNAGRLTPRARDALLAAGVAV